MVVYLKTLTLNFIEKNTLVIVDLQTEIHHNNMLNPTTAAFIAIFVLEIAFIIIGNVFTIIICWTLRLRLKQTFFLLINLTVADLLVGIAEGAALAIHRSPRTEMQPEGTRSPAWVFQPFGTCTSVMFLALVSLERVHAVLLPMRHRVTRTRAYVFSIVMVRAAGLCIAALALLTEYHAQVDVLYVIVASDFLILVSLVVICASYLSIRSRLNHISPNLQAPHKRSMERNTRLSKTLYIVVAVSLIFWVPAFVVFSIKIFCWKCFPPFSLWLISVLHLANSMVNPFVYSFRMPIFKSALKKLWKKPGGKVELRSVSLQVPNGPQQFTAQF